MLCFAGISGSIVKLLFACQLANEQGNYGLALQCNHEKMISMYEQEQEHKRLVKEITDEVLKRLSLSVDTKNRSS